MGFIESSMWNSILAMAETVVLTVCTWYFMSHTEQNITKPARGRLLAFSVFWAGYAALSYGFSSSAWGNIPAILFMAAGSMFIGHKLYNGRRIYLFYYFLYPVTYVLMQIFVIYLVYGFIMSQWGMFVFDYYSANIALIIKQLAALLLTGVWVALLNRRQFEDVSGFQFAGLFLPPLISAFIIASLIVLGNVYIQLYGAYLVIVDICFLVFMNLYILYLFSYQSRNRKLKEELKTFQRQSEMQYHYYEKLEEKYESSRKLIHDMRNHLQSIEALCQMSRSEAGNAYARDMHRMLDSFAQRQYTDSHMLNIILNDKAETARQKNIHMEVRIGKIQLGHMKDMDVTTVFANLLDNALEAAERSGDKRYITVKADSFREFSVVKICNSYDPAADKNGKDSVHRGIGLGNVRQTLKRCGGGMDIEEKDREFAVSITIPISEGDAAETR